MVDVGEKHDVLRVAEARGRIRLKTDTVRRIKEGRIDKGDVVAAAQIAGILAAKKTPELIPLCHPIPITGVDIDVEAGDSFVEVKATVRSVGKTGVEMEALTAVSIALLVVWDMCKQYEKDEYGQYPETVIEEVRVVNKLKEEKG
ncbi:MAG: cyclic pyranopterin monophosphate synthase MoaC [Candidatus Jordarchaeales archaeon]|nr:cyclic pyranopterin monophosphate synthase MoaC [Candidatus Jordarchaeia archaeon]